MQMTGSPILFSSVHSHVDVAPVSSPTRAACGACSLMNAAILDGIEPPTSSTSVPCERTGWCAASTISTSRCNTAMRSKASKPGAAPQFHGCRRRAATRADPGERSERGRQARSAPAPCPVAPFPAESGRTLTDQIIAWVAASMRCICLRLARNCMVSPTPVTELGSTRPQTSTPFTQK